MILTMPTAALRPCASPGCPELVARGRCSKHETAHQVADRQRRGSAAERGYGSRWQRARVVFLGANPLCAPCSRKTPPQITPATVVDHIRDHKGDQLLFWDEKNWQPSCQPCHDARTDAGDFGRSR
jgi:5-methylcytosine-specific restriction protein A